MKMKRKFLSFLSVLSICFSTSVLTSCKMETFELQYTLLEDGSGYSVTYVGNEDNGSLGFISNINEIVIPAEYNSKPVLEIADGAFDNERFQKTKSIVIPDSVIKIGDCAFISCYSLQSIRIPASVISIGENVFNLCESLKSIEVDSNNKYYDSRDNCNALIETSSNTLIRGCINTKIPAEITAIGAHAFACCKTLKEITIPVNVTSIGFAAFSQCLSLENVYYQGTINDWCNISLNSIESQPMIWAEHFLMLDSNSEYYEVTKIEIPEEITAIGDFQFNSFANVTNIVLHDNITSIGSCAFENCSSLKNINIPNSVTSISISVFKNCISLTNITFPNCLTNIGDYMFSHCELLQSITIPSSVISIGWYSFEGCSSLESIIIPDSVTSINSWAFEGCISLTNVYYTGSEEQWDVITIGSDNEELTSATITYNYVPEK